MRRTFAMLIALAGCGSNAPIEFVDPGTVVGGDEVEEEPEPVDAAPGSAGAGGRGGTDGGSRGGSGGTTPPTRDAGAVPDRTPIPTVDCKVAKFCDDFESQVVGKAPTGYGLRLSGGTLTVDTSKAFSGTKAVYIKNKVGATQTTALLTRGRGTLPLPGNVVFGRMMVYLTASPQGVVHWDNIIFNGRIPGTTTNAQYAYGGHQNGRLIVVYNPHDCNTVSRTPFPTGRWTCLQWQFDGPNMTARLWVDGKSITDQTVVGKSRACVDGSGAQWVAPSFDNMQLGWINYQASPIPIEMWMDDIAVDSNQIACPTMP